MGKRQGLQFWTTVPHRERQSTHPGEARVGRFAQPEPSRPAGRQRQSLHRWHLLLLLGLAGAALLWESTQAAHIVALRWMSGYKSADGVGCCSARDCLPWPVAVLQLTEDQATVRIGDTVVQLPIRSVHATQDGQTYWCC